MYHGKLREDSIYLPLYIEDMLIVAKRKLAINNLKKQLNKEFHMKDLGGARKIFAIEITQDKRIRKKMLSQ